MSKKMGNKKCEKIDVATELQTLYAACKRLGLDAAQIIHAACFSQKVQLAGFCNPVRWREHVARCLAILCCKDLYLTGIAKRSFTSGRKRTGWRSEDGTIPPLYRANMQEHASANYLGRTRRNVVDSHATLIITNAYPLSGGTLKTRFFCEEMMRSHFVVSLGESDAVGKVQRWLVQFFAQEHPVPFVLNVAGPRESKAGGIQKRTRHFLAEVLQGMLENAGSNGAAPFSESDR